MLYILLFFVLILLGLSYRRNKSFLFVPSIMCIASFVIGLIFLSIKIDYLGYKISIETVFFILFGLSSVFLGEYITKVSSYLSKRELSIRKSWLNIIEFRINKKISVVLFIINCIVTYLFSKEIIRIAFLAELTSLGNFSEIMASYRTAMMFGDSINFNISPVVSQLQKIVTISSYLYLFVFIANVTKGMKLKSNIMNIIVVLPYFVITYLSGGRIGFIKILIAILLFIYICCFLEFEKRKFIYFFSKFKIYVILSFVGILLVFYSLRIALGRLSSEDAKFSDYITMYIGVPILNFDLYLKDNKSYSFNISKSETFNGISVFINKLEGDKVNIGLPFKYTKRGESLGNVYTSFRRYHHDFGIFGVFMMPFLMSFILSKILNIAFFKSYNSKSFSFLIILYGYLYAALPTYAAEDIFFIRLNIGFIEEILLLYIMNRYLIKSIYAFK